MWQKWKKRVIYERSILDPSGIQNQDSSASAWFTQGTWKTDSTRFIWEGRKLKEYIRWERNSRPRPTLMDTVVMRMHTHIHHGCLTKELRLFGGRSSARARLSQQHPQSWTCLDVSIPPDSGTHTHTMGALPPTASPWRAVSRQSPAQPTAPTELNVLRHLHPSRLTEPMACWCRSVKTQLTCLDKPWDSISILSSPAGAGRGWDFSRRYLLAGLPAFFFPVPPLPNSLSFPLLGALR